MGLGLFAFWLLGTVSMAIVLRGEQEELLDLTLRETAELLRPALVARLSGAEGTETVAAPMPDPGDETLVFALQDGAGTVLLQSDGFIAEDLPSGPPRAGYRTGRGHALYSTEPDAQGYVATFGDPLAERAEAFRESLLAFLLPSVVLLPLAYLALRWLVGIALRPLSFVGAQIGARSESRLDPIDVEAQPTELRPVVETLNVLMTRLGQTLEAERAFATNAAHELRTPVAVALAQVQRLRSEATDEASLGRIVRVEAALQRMSRLVGRLLQLARADAGIGAASTPLDMAALLRLIAEESLRQPERAGRLHMTLPDGPVAGRIDADAFAILVGNLIDNAFQHAPADSRVEIVLGTDASLTVHNTGPMIPAADLTDLKGRFQRGRTGSEGFGLGLYIADAIARQSGGQLVLESPAAGRTDGVSATFQAAV